MLRKLRDLRVDYFVLRSLARRGQLANRDHGTDERTEMACPRRVKRALNDDFAAIELLNIVPHGPSKFQPDCVLKLSVCHRIAIGIQGVAFELDSSGTPDANLQVIEPIGIGKDVG